MDAQQDLLHTADPKDYDLLLIQEPYIDFVGNTRANFHWTVVYPPGHRDQPKKTRSVILVNKQIATNAWTQLEARTPDVTAIMLRSNAGETAVFNIYNDCSHDKSIDEINRYLRGRNTSGLSTASMVWAGDFNRHHPLWDEARNNHLFTTSALDAAHTLITALSIHDLQMVLPRDIPTLEALATKNLTRVDNVFVSRDLVDRVERCETDPELRPTRTDHFPVLTTFNMETDAAPQEGRKNYRATDWEKFGEGLRTRLAELGMPREFEEEEREEAEEARRRLEEAVQQTIEEFVPRNEHTPYTRRWWSRELGRMRATKQKWAKKAHCARADSNNPAHETYRRARSDYAQAMKRARREKWEEWMEGLEGEEVWAANRMIGKGGTDGGRTRIPVLEGSRGQKATTNEEKGEMFFRTFFPARTAAATETDDTRYPRARWDYQPTTNEQIDRIIRTLKPFKASRSDSAPNAVFTNNREALVPYLGPIFRAVDTLQYYPEDWKRTETPVLRKPGKPKYTVPGAYRPIVLSNSFARILNACKTEDLAKMAELTGMLPAYHFGGHPGRATTDSIHHVVKIIKDAWRRKKVASVLFLDVKGAFPSVAIDVLLHEMRLMGVPKEHVEWVRRRNEGRKTTITFDDYISEPFGVDDGLDQGDAHSLILYIIYNSGILKIPEKRRGEGAVAFVDDAAMIAVGDDFRETHRSIKSMMEREGGVMEWAEKHNCSFGVEKFQLVDASRKMVNNPLGTGKKVPMERPDLKIREHTIKSVPYAKFLGVNIDQNLRWREQGAAAVAKGAGWYAQFGRIARTVTGVPHQQIRRLYLSVAIPRILYAADVWCSTTERNPRGGSSTRGKLAAIHGRIANMIVGGMRSSPRDTAEAHANLPPFHILIDNVRHGAALRLATLPATHPLHTPVKAAAKRMIRTHPTPLHDLMHTFKIKPERMEKIASVRKDTRWQSTITTSIPETQEEAEKEEDERGEDKYRVYTDGSGIEGKIGAAAVLYRGRVEHKTLRYQLGSEKRHTVYEGEGVGLLLGLELIARTVIRGRVTITIGVDNQAAIQATDSKRPNPSHYLWDWVHTKAARLQKQKQHVKLAIRWTPGHTGIEGNERADEEAKAAATGGSSDQGELPKVLTKTLPWSKSAVKQTYRAKSKKRAEREWRESRRFNRLARYDDSMPSQKYGKLVKGLRRKHASILYQLRTGHIPLGKHLHRIGKADSPNCPCCGQEDENVAHYLLRCGAYRTERARMMMEAGVEAGMLNGLLSKPTLIPHLMRFVARTGRLRSVFGAIPEIPTTGE